VRASEKKLYNFRSVKHGKEELLVFVVVGPFSRASSSHSIVFQKRNVSSRPLLTSGGKEQPKTRQKSTKDFTLLTRETRENARLVKSSSSSRRRRGENARAEKTKRGERCVGFNRE